MADYSNLDSACCYNKLDNYNNFMINTPMRPGETVGYYTVPNYKPIQYNALSNPELCGQYNNITSAYGRDSVQCNQLYHNNACSCPVSAPAMKCPPHSLHADSFVCVKDHSDKNQVAKACGLLK